MVVPCTCNVYSWRREEESMPVRSYGIGSRMGNIQ
jgi:hypothetical protein